MNNLTGQVMATVKVTREEYSLIVTGAVEGKSLEETGGITSLESHGFQNREMWLVYPTARKPWIPFWKNRAAMPNRVKSRIKQVPRK